MKNQDELQNLLHRIDGRGYPAYKELAGAWDLGGFTLMVDHVQGDPFAAPSRLRLLIPPGTARIPEAARRSRPRAEGAAWLFTRRFAAELERRSGRRGSGRSGALAIDRPGQEVLRRTTLTLDGEGGVEARLTAGLPARGRRILGRQAAAMLVEDLAGAAAVLRGDAHPPEEIERFAGTNEDAQALREMLPGRELVAFVADGSILPRRSGVDDRPLEAEAVPFASPPSLRTAFTLPNRGEVTGMGIGRGVTLIVGGGFHGKSTLLRALEKGIWNHAAGDGRELVVTRADAVKIRAEDGRSVAGVDISPFIRELPGGRATTRFATPNASGSTSQAANIVEALEAGAGTLLVDEDTAATNFMVRDRRMQELVHADREPIVPFVDRVRWLQDRLGVSTILVMGGSGDYFDTADRVIAMEEYRPRDVTAGARRIAAAHPTGRESPPHAESWRPPHRVPRRTSIDPARGRRESHMKIREAGILELGRERIDLRLVEQLVDTAQTRALGKALLWLARRGIDDRRSLPELLDLVEEELAQGGLDRLDPARLSDLAWFRRQELAAALNRLRTLAMAP